MEITTKNKTVRPTDFDENIIAKPMVFEGPFATPQSKVKEGNRRLSFKGCLHHQLMLSSCIQYNSELAYNLQRTCLQTQTKQNRTEQNSAAN